MEHVSILNFQSMITHGAKQVISIEKELNEINVFPVPDGDTGSNLAFLMNMILLKQNSPTQSFEQLKMACLEGSRGNSGMIFSQFIIAMCDFIADKTHLTKEQFVDMCEQSYAKTYKAVHQPVEGTILTVMRDWVKSLKSYKLKVNSFTDLLTTSLKDAFHSLEKTKYIRIECRKQNVVDAGAKGFYYFLQGFVEGMTRKIDLTLAPPITSSHFEEELAGLNHDFNEDHLHYRYCSEFIVNHIKDEDELKTELSKYGDSLVFIHSQEMCKCHIHTNSPEQIAHLLQQRGSIQFQKVEDMQKQKQMITERKSSYAIVVDSACDLPQAFIDQYDVYMLPLSISVDDSHYLDKLTLTANQLYSHMEIEDIKITTSLPSREQIVRLYKQLLSHYDSIISIHVSSQLSGTFHACKQIAEQLDEHNIIVIDSKTLSGSYGLIVKRVADYLQTNRAISKTELNQFINFQKAKNQIYVTVPTLKSMVNSGRVPKRIGRLADKLAVKPIVSIDKDGKAKMLSPTVFQQSNLPKLIKHIEKIHKKSPISEYVILYTDDISGLKLLKEKMKNMTGIEPTYITTVSSVIGKFAGKGAYSIAFI